MPASAAARLQQLATAEGSTLSPTTVFVMGGVTERYRHEAERHAHKVPGLLHELRGPEWRKLTAIMERRRLELGAQYRWVGTVPATTAPGIRSTPPAQPPSSAPLARTPTSDQRPGPAPGAPTQTPVPAGEPTADPSAANVAASSPTATHPAASRPAPTRLVPTSWSADAVSDRAGDADPLPSNGTPVASSNGEGPHSEDR